MVFKRRSRRLWRIILLVMVALAILLNGIAFMQARAMTHYTTAAARTAQPEKLSFLAKARVILTGVSLPRPINGRSPQTNHVTAETHRIAIAEGYLSAWYLPVPAAKGLVLLFPAYAASKQMLLPAATLLNELGYAALLVDFRGVGDASGSDTTLGMREAADVAAAYGYAQQQWSDRPIFLYGASMGATAVMRAVAQTGIAPAAIVLESPFDRLLNTVRQRFEALGVPAFPSAELIVFWGGVQQQIDGFSHNPVEYARSIRCPVLLLHGDRDRRVRLPAAQAIYANLAGKKQLVTFAGMGHGSFATDDGLQWKQAIGRFLVAFGQK